MCFHPKKYLNTIKAILLEGIEKGKFRNDIDLNATAIAFLGLVQSMITLWSLRRYSFALNKNKIIETFKLLERGIVKKFNR